jgi:ubiquinone/menaquinone biosynthesis C-methylase UbiE
MQRNNVDEVTEVIRHHWNWRAATFDRELSQGLHSDRQREAWLELLAGLVGARPQRILDVGCGTGFLALLLAELGHEVTGIDLAPQMIELARQKAAQAKLDVTFRVDNAASLADPDETYDVVVERHVIWTLPDPQAGVREWLRVLRPGGRLVAIEVKFARNEALAKRYSHPLRAAFNASVEAAMALVCRLAGRGYGRLYWKKYKRIDAQLPFSGGPHADRLADVFREEGYGNVTVHPLMSQALWEEHPRDPRYLVLATRLSTAANARG